MVKIKLFNNKKPRVTGLFIVICVEVLVLRKNIVDLGVIDYIFCMLTLLKIYCKYCFRFDYKDKNRTKKVRSVMMSEPLNIYLDL